MQASRIRGGLWAAILIALVMVACNTSTGAATLRIEEPAAAGHATAQPPIVGTWQRITYCTQLVTALTHAGLKKFVLEFVAGNGFIPGVTSPDDIADRRHPCAGAVPRRHSHFFTKGRAFGSLDWRGEQVDDGTYRLVNSRTITIFKEFPKVSFRYRIRANAITFAPVIVKGCLTFRCAWAISMAYPGKRWQRVR